MPNWCSNSVILRHNDPAEISRAAEAFRRGEFLSQLVPDPSGEENLGWAVANWGTKWDVGGDGHEAVVTDNGQSACFNFDSAWAPPITAYEHMTQQGFRIEAMYYESGCGFAGMWDSEFGDDYYDLNNMDSGDVAQQLPSDLNNAFGISESMAMYEQDNAEPEPLTEWYTAGVTETMLEPHVLNTKTGTDHV